MNATPYSENNREFTDKAHEAAKLQVYPLLFGKSFEIKDTKWSSGSIENILDGQLGIDKLISVPVREWNAPIRFTVQERWRDPKYEIYHDITITEWNHKTNVAGELYRICAGIFLYGYFDEATNKITYAIAVDVTSLMIKIIRGSFKLKRAGNPRSSQSFACFNINELVRAGIVIMQYNRSEKINCIIVPLGTVGGGEYTAAMQGFEVVSSEWPDNAPRPILTVIPA
jgi:hypothetical protein